MWIGDGKPPAWPAGTVLRADARPAAVAECVTRELPDSDAAAWLFWGSGLGEPDAKRIREALALPGDLWHAGLRLGMAGLPHVIDHVAPTWMLNRDPDPSIAATSWRVSAEACLVKTDVLRRVGGFRPAFRTLAGAALEFGHRCVTAGVLTRHVGSIAGDAARSGPQVVPIEDELRFIRYRFGRVWSRWVLFRLAATGRLPATRGLRALRRLEAEPLPNPAPPYRQEPAPGEGKPAEAGTVTVLIPTVDRYPYLQTLLEQLRAQTVRPLEIVIVDQTPADRRQVGLAERFPDLPIHLIALDRAGQCSSRNAGIEASRGDFLLFLDDDDEIPPDLIANHLAALERFRNDVSCGVAEEDGAGPLPEAFRRTRASDVFPTNNSLIRKRALAGSGLFDLAYDRGARADADLGMRLYLAGNLMVLSSSIGVIHRHAPSGGLRTHGARVITYASSRTRLWHRHVPAVTEIYLARRYFSVRQVREMLWLAVFGTFAARGGARARLTKVMASSLGLPDTLWKVRVRSRQARALLSTHPRIPELSQSARDRSNAVSGPALCGGRP